jgi:exodeoxyribonuclease VII large subunit
MRGRHTAELTHQLRSVIINALTRREREFRALALRLEARDLRRRFAAIRGKLDAATGRLHAGIGRRHDRAAARLATAVGRLESLSPLAVLGRGYAVCWNDDRTAILRTAATIAAGERVHVTLHDGALNCVVETTDKAR